MNYKDFWNFEFDTVQLAQWLRLVWSFVAASVVTWHLISAMKISRYHSYKWWIMIIMPSMRWSCWLGSRKGIQPVKNWVVGCWRGYLSGAMCRFAYGPSDATATHCLLLQSIQIGFTFLVLPFWYWLTRVVPDKVQGS